MELGINQQELFQSAVIFGRSARVCPKMFFAKVNVIIEQPQARHQQTTG